MKKALIFLGLGSEIGVLVVGSYQIGLVLDEKYKTNGMIFVGLSFACLIAWMVHIFWMLKKFEADGADEE